MAEIVNINPINPTTFEFQEYSVSDTSLITSVNVDTSFDPNMDYLEYFIYDLNGNILIQNTSGYPGYKLINNNLVLNPEADLRAYGYNEGQYNTVYNFLSPKLSSNDFNTYYISQISPDRTEIRLDTTSIPNELVISSSLELINDINNSTGSYYDFYLDFGNNDLVIAVNALLDTSSIDNPTVLIKLYEPLPPQFNTNFQCWVVTQVASPVAYNISITQTFDVTDNHIQLKGPNFNLNISDQINNSTDYSNYQTLSSTNSSTGSNSLNYQLNNILAQTGIVVNVDYSDYANFIHFSSALTRLENFYYKLQLLEEYTYSSSLSSGPSSGSYYVSSSNLIWQSKINEIITTFDPYEYYLYYSSGSTCWPKSNQTPPYINVSTTSSQGLSWFGNQSVIAENYDSENNNALILSIPSYIRDDNNNDQYTLFVEMVGQLFDEIFIYLQNITSKANNDNRLDYGVSKDLIADVLRDLGIKIYQNNFSSNNLYQSLIGITSSGSLYNLPFTTNQYPVPSNSGLEYIQTYITASSTSSLYPTYDINASTYKRLYNSLPYILKKKGTYAGLRALITLFGIPDTILRISEFGGQNKINIDDYDYWYEQFNYAFNTSGSNYITSSFSLNPLWSSDNNKPQSVEFRFKTNGLPQNTASIASQSLWSTNSGVNIRLRYTGSGYNTAPYNGGPINPYYQYALLDFIPDSSNPSISASVYLPFFDGGWWSVLINKNNLATSSSLADYELIVKNKIYNGDNGYVVGYQASSSLYVSSYNTWNTSTTSVFGSGSLGKIFSGSLQEIRYYTTPLNQNKFDDYVMNPYAFDGNTINSAPDVLAFRAPLGTELNTGSITSIHPKVTGSWTPIPSFPTGSNFYYFSTPVFNTNTETIFVNEFPVGIKNRISNKIQPRNIVLPYSSSNNNIPNSDVLSPFISVQQTVPKSGSYTKAIDYVEIAFSPQNEINDDINEQLGYFNIGDFIGDPRQVSTPSETYPDLDALRDAYFEKYTSNYQWFDYIRLIEFFDNSLFKMLQDFIPARSDLASGIVVKQTVLERNKYPVPQATTSASLAFVGTNSSSVGIPYIVEDQTITGSINIGMIEGGNGGSMPNLFGQTQSFDYYVNITQSWSGNTLTPVGYVPYVHSDQEEFYNGELSGSNLVVTNGNLDNCNVTIVQVYSTSSLPADQINTFTGYYLNTYNLNPSKTYYLTFTETNNGAALGNGALQIYDSSNLQGNVRVLYNGSDLAPGASRTVTNLEIQAVFPPLIFSRNNILSYIEITNLVISESYVEPDCLVIQNDAQVERQNIRYMIADFNNSFITASNEAAILGGYATKAFVQDSNYTTARVINPRYNGCETISPTGSIFEGYVNQPMIKGSSIGAVANVEQHCDWFAYFDGIQLTNYLTNTGMAFVSTPIYSVHITTLIDVYGNKIGLDSNHNSYPVSGTGSYVLNPLAGTFLQNPLVSNIPVLNSIFPYSGSLSLKQYTNSTGSAVSGSFNPFMIASSGFSPSYSSLDAPYYWVPNETIITLFTGSGILPNTTTPGVLIPSNFNPQYKNNILKIAQSAGFFKNI